MSSKTLLIDLGGTNLRSGIGDTESLKVSDVKKFPIKSNEDFYEALQSVNAVTDFSENRKYAIIDKFTCRIFCKSWQIPGNIQTAD